MNHAIEYLTEYPISWKDLEVLTDDEKAFLALVSFAVTELNVMMRVCIFSEQSQEHNEPIDIAILTQRYVTLRVWSAKLFEFFNRIKEMNEPKTKRKIGESVSSIVEYAAEMFSPLEEHNSSSIVENIRHEATNHYSFSAAKKNLKHVSPTVNCNLYAHEWDENSFFPMGEQVMFGGRFSRFSSGRKPENRGGRQLEQWMDWNLKATEAIRSIYKRVLEDLVEAKFPDKRARRKDYWISPKLAGGASEHGVPVFLRRDS